MRTVTWLAVAGAAIAALLSDTAVAQRTITLPSETAVYRANDLPGYPLVQRDCLLCHSAHYVAMQPPTSPRSYWDATVRKMKNPGISASCGESWR